MFVILKLNFILLNKILISALERQESWLKVFHEIYAA